MTDAADPEPLRPRRWPRKALVATGILVAVLILVWVAWLSLAALINSGALLKGTVCDTGESPFGSFGAPVTIAVVGAGLDGGCPREVVPERQPDSAQIVVQVEGGFPGWIEGGYFFLRGRTPQGEIVAEQRLESDHAEVYVPAGVYTITMYGRSCSAACPNLDPPSFICSYEVTGAANETTTVRYDWQTCAAESGAASGISHDSAR